MWNYIKSLQIISQLYILEDQVTNKEQSGYLNHPAAITSVLIIKQNLLKTLIQTKPRMYKI